mmetsp:Transcript_37884/g.125558  ORF Transcript_37884/g.125558 Transcript_37884/m.125558 type:complete len:245 (-) Transcript_37884:526-1260(-)
MIMLLATDVLLLVTLSVRGRATRWAKPKERCAKRGRSWRSLTSTGAARATSAARRAPRPNVLSRRRSESVDLSVGRAGAGQLERTRAPGRRVCAARELVASEARLVRGLLARLALPSPLVVVERLCVRRLGRLPKQQLRGVRLDPTDASHLEAPLAERELDGPVRRPHLRRRLQRVADAKRVGHLLLSRQVGAESAEQDSNPLVAEGALSVALLGAGEGRLRHRQACAEQRLLAALVRLWQRVG